MSQISKSQGTFGATLSVAALHDMDDGYKAAINYTYFIEFGGDPNKLAKAISKLPMVEFVAKMEVAEGIGEK
jgi:hypothetical protein